MVLRSRTTSSVVSYFGDLQVGRVESGYRFSNRRGTAQSSNGVEEIS
jgi:hypothetical protein